MPYDEPPEDDIVPHTELPREPRRPLWFWLLLLAGIVFVLFGVANAIGQLSLRNQLSGKDEVIDAQQAQIDALTAANACRSQIAADDAVAQSNKQITSQRVVEVFAASVFARDPNLPEDERAAWAEAALKAREVFLADVDASFVRFQMAQRRVNVNELCSSGEVPQPQVQPLPVAPIVELPGTTLPTIAPGDPNAGTGTMPSSTGGSQGETITLPPGTTRTTPPPSGDGETASPAPTTTRPGAPTTASPGTPAPPGATTTTVRPSPGTTTTVAPTTTTTPGPLLGVCIEVLGLPILC